MIGKIAKTIETKKDLIRIKVNLDETSNETFKIARTVTHRTVWHLIELIDALYHMSCSDTIKFEIYETNKMSVHLRSIINHGNATEIEYCLKLIGNYVSMTVLHKMFETTKLLRPKSIN